MPCMYGDYHLFNDTMRLKATTTLNNKLDLDAQESLYLD